MKGDQRQCNPLVDAVGRFVERHRLIEPGAGVVTAVSGGADSVALLGILRQLAGDAGWRLTVAHLDHSLRADSAEDAAFVKGLSGQWGLECVVERRDIRAEAEFRGVGLEEAGRDARYMFLADAARRCGASVVATGHHADDNVETILRRIARGTHLRGLAGMPVARDLAGGARLVRPLLACRRSELDAFCRESGLAWRTDPTNANPAMHRNHIRHKVLPLLRELNPRVEEAVLRLAGAAGRAEGLIDFQAQALLERAIADERAGRIVLRADVLAAAADPLAAHALRGALERLGAGMKDVTAERLREMLAVLRNGEPPSISLPGGVDVRRDRDELIIEEPAGEPAREADDGPAGVPLNCPGRTALPGGGQVVLTLVQSPEARYALVRAESRPGVERVDADRIVGTLTCGPRRRGDRFLPLGSPGTQTVSDFLTNAKLPQRRRAAVRCIRDEAGIVCLAPLRIAERVKVTDATRRILLIEFRGREGASM